MQAMLPYTIIKQLYTLRMHKGYASSSSAF